MRRMVATIGLAAMGTAMVLAPASVAGARQNARRAQLFAASGASGAGATSGSLGATAGSSLSLVVAPGSTLSSELQLANPTANPWSGITLQTSLENGSGRESLTIDETSRWLSLGVTLADVRPHETIRIPYSVTVPLQATASQQSWLVVARQAGSELARAVVVVKVDGPSRSALRVVSVTNETVGSRRTLAVLVHNDGNVGADISGDVVVDALKLSKPFRIHADSQRDAIGVVDWKPLSLSYEVSVAGRSGIDSITWSGRVDTSGANAGTPGSGAIAGAGAQARGNAGETARPSTPSPGSTDSTGSAGSPTSTSSGWWLTIALAIAIVGAFGWFVAELVASRRGRSTALRTAGVGVASGAFIGGEGLSSQLAPLVHAIEQLARSMQVPNVAFAGTVPVNVVPVNVASAGVASVESVATHEFPVDNAGGQPSDEWVETAFGSVHSAPIANLSDEVVEDAMNSSDDYFNGEGYAAVRVAAPVDRAAVPAPAAVDRADPPDPRAHLDADSGVRVGPDPGADLGVDSGPVLKDSTIEAISVDGEVVTTFVHEPATIDTSASRALASIESATSAVIERLHRDEPIEANLVLDDHAARDIPSAAHCANLGWSGDAGSTELLNEVAMRLGIARSVLQAWIPSEMIATLGTTESNSNAGTRATAHPPDVATLERENAVLALEVAILKRAVAHFSRA